LSWARGVRQLVERTPEAVVDAERTLADLDILIHAIEQAEEAEAQWRLEIDN
jgi:hypothetical protein